MPGVGIPVGAEEVENGTGVAYYESAALVGDVSEGRRSKDCETDPESCRDLKDFAEFLVKFHKHVSPGSTRVGLMVIVMRSQSYGNSAMTSPLMPHNQLVLLGPGRR